MEIKDYMEAQSNRINYKTLGEIKDALDEAPGKIIIGDKEISLHRDDDTLDRVKEVLENFRETVHQEIIKLDEELKEI